MRAPGLVWFVAVILAGCSCGCAGSDPAPGPIVAAILVDFSGSFAPLQVGDHDALRFIAGGLAKAGAAEGRAVRVYWLTIGERRDSSGRLCKDIALAAPSLLHVTKAPDSGTSVEFTSIDDFRQALVFCADAIVTRSRQSRQTATDIADAFIRAAQTLAGGTAPAASASTDRIVFALSDFVQDGVAPQLFASDSFRGIRVFLLYRGLSTPGVTSRPAPEMWLPWEKRLRDAGATIVPPMKIGALDEHRVVSLFR